MIDFACKKIEIRQVVKCGLGLSKADFKLMDFMLKNEDKYFTTHELSKKLNLNLSTIQRSVKKLYEKAIIDRKQINLGGGGYLFTYQSKDKSEVRKLVISVVRSWTKNVEAEINRW
jgi:predicted transcriptional regulator